MEITQEMLEERKAQMQADITALAGALQQIDWTLEKLAEEPPDHLTMDDIAGALKAAGATSVEGPAPNAAPGGTE